MRCQIDERVYYSFEEIEQNGNYKSPVTEVGRDAEFSRISQNIPALKTNPGFWRRQFGRDVTTEQRKFDWFIGVVMPMICIYFDPFVFRGWYGQGGILSKYQLFVYVLSSVSIMAMAAWLLWGDRLKGLTGWFAGLFISASVICLAVGLILFPMSLFGLVLVFIGALGFTPVFASVVYMRNAVRALRAASSSFERKTLVYVAAFSGLISLVVPWVINQTFDTGGRSLDFFW